MICTEQEAAQKWCPQARVGSSREPGFCINRNLSKPADEAMCIGSRCMVWVWTDPETETGYFANSQVDAAKEAGWVLAPDDDDLPCPGQAFMKRPRVVRRGTCGLIHGSGS